MSIEKNNTPRIPVEPVEPQETESILPEEYKNPEEGNAEMSEKEQKDVEKRNKRAELWRRVDIALDYKKHLIDDPAIEEMTAEEFSKKGEYFFSENIFLRFPVESREIIDTLWGGEGGRLQLKELRGEELTTEEKEKLKEIKVFRENPDAKLYESLVTNINELREKKEMVDKVKSGEKTLEKEFERLEKAGYDVPDLKEVTPLNIFFKPFAVVLTFSKKDFDDQMNEGRVESSGTFWKDTPFIAIRESEEEKDTEYNIDHEYTHAILDGGIENKIFYLPFYKRSLEKSIKSGDDNATRAVVEKISNDSEFFLNATHNELLANWKQTEDLLHLGWLYDTEVGEGISEKNFSKVGMVFATAGEQMKSFLKFLEEKSSEIQDEEMRGMLINAKENLKQNFLRIANEVQEAGGIAKRIGDEASQDQHMLMTILQPTEWKHAKGVLAHKYGEEKVETALKTYQEVRKFTPDVESLKSIVKKARNGEIHLTEEDIKTLQVRHILLGKGKKDEPIFFEKSEDFIEYGNLMEECYHMMGYRRDTIAEFTYRYHKMWGSGFRQRVGKNPEEIEAFYEKINDEQKHTFRNIFIFEVLQKIFEIRQQNHGKPIDEDALKDDVLWQCTEKDWCKSFVEGRKNEIEKAFGR